MAGATDRIISSEQRTLIEHLLCERISRRGICRAVGVSLTWLLHFIVERFAACPDHLHVQLPVSPTAVVIRPLEAEADEMWSFVQKKAYKQWIWIAMDAKTRQIMAFHVGDRSRDSAKQLWAKIPLAYREQATFHTDQYEAYQSVIPAPRHKAITKHARKTIMSSASITRCGSGCPAWGAKPCRSPSNWQPYRCDQVFHLPRQSLNSRSITCVARSTRAEASGQAGHSRKPRA